MDQVTLVIPPCPKTTRGETSFLEASPTHLLYFNGCTVVLRPLGNVSCLSITHTCAVSAVKFSTGQQQVASIDEKGTLMIHGIQQGKVVHIKTYEECFPNCKAMDWTADNKKLCVVGAGKNKFGKVLTVETGVSVGELSAVTANLTTCSFRPEKPYKLMVGGEEFQVKAYDGPPYKFTCSQKSHSNFINQLKYSPDGETIVSVGSDRKIVLYNGHTATIQKQLSGAHEGGIMGVVWLDSSIFVTGSSDKKLKKWNKNLEMLVQLHSCTNQLELAMIDSFVVGLTFEMSNKRIYFVMLSGEIAETDDNLSSITRRFEGHRNKPVKVFPLPSLENSALLIDNHGKVLKISANNSEVHRYNPKMLCHNKMLQGGCLSNSGTAFILDAEQQVFEIDPTSTEAPPNIQFTKVVGAKLITPLSNPKGFVCYTKDLMNVYANTNGKYQQIGTAKLAYNPTAVFADPANPTTLIVGSDKGKIEVFNIQLTQQQAAISKITQAQCNANKITAISKAGELLFTGDSMGSIKVFKFPAESGEVSKVSDSMGSHTAQITSIIVRNELIYTFSMDTNYSVWKLDSFSRTTTFSDVHRNGILHANIVGNCLITCGGDLLVKVHSF